MGGKKTDLEKIIDKAAKLPSPDTEMGTERNRSAAGVAMNQEWKFYIATETDNLLRSMACEDYEGMTVEQVGKKVLGTIGEISALGKAYNHFASCLANSNKEDTEKEESK